MHSGHSRPLKVLDRINLQRIVGSPGGHTWKINEKYLSVSRLPISIKVPRQLACPSDPTIKIVSMKKPHLELSNSIWILLEYWIFFSLVFFVKIWQCLALRSCQSKRLIIARYETKWLCSKKNFVHEVGIRENLAMSPKVQGAWFFHGYYLDSWTTWTR